MHREKRRGGPEHNLHIHTQLLDQVSLFSRVFNSGDYAQEGHEIREQRILTFFSRPAVHLPVPSKFTIVVRFCPLLYELRKVPRMDSSGEVLFCLDLMFTGFTPARQQQL